MGFKQGDVVTVQGLRGGVYQDRISDGSEGTVAMVWSEMVPQVEAMYGVEFPGVNGLLVLYGSELALTEDLQPPTSGGVVVGDRVTATWGSFEGSVGTVRETKIAGGTGKPIASVIWDNAPWVYSEVLEVVEDEAPSTEPVAGDRVIITELSGNRTKSTFLGEGLLGTVTEVLPGHSGNIYWVAFHDQWGQDLMLSHEIRKVD